MTNHEEFVQELEEGTSDRKTVVFEIDDITSLDENEFPDNAVKAKVLKEDGKGISLGSKASPTEPTSNAEDYVKSDNMDVSSQSTNSSERDPGSTVIISAEIQLNSVRNGTRHDADDGKMLCEDELGMSSNEDNAPDYQDVGQETNSRLSGIEIIKQPSLEIKLMDNNQAESDKMPSQDTKESDEDLDLETNGSLPSAHGDAGTTDDDSADVQGSVVNTEKKEHESYSNVTPTAKGSQTVKSDNGLVNQEIFVEVVSMATENTSSHKQLTSCLKTAKGSSLTEKSKKNVSIDDTVCEGNETEIGSITIGVMDSPRTTPTPTIFNYNVLDEFLSNYGMETIETDDSHPLCTIRFKLDSGKMFAGAFEGSCTIRDVKFRLARLFEIDYEIITLEQGGSDISDWLVLSSLCTEGENYLDMQLSSRDSETAINTEFVSKFIPTVEVIAVHCHLGEDVYKDIIVEIEDQSLRKEWLGGYRNKMTELVYHHAATQTLPKERKVFEKTDSGELVPILYERQVQTPFPVKNFAVDTPVNKATQMHRRDYYVAITGDKIVAPTNFVTYEEWLEKNDVIRKVVTLQRAVKNWMKNKTFKKLFEAQRIAVKLFRDEKVKILTEQAERKRKIISGAALPTSRDDFYMLYLMVGRWWKKEWQRIKDIRSDESRKAEYVALLEKEIELLSAIEKQRIIVKGESLRKEKMRLLEVTSRPTVFRNERGVMTSMDGVDTQRARTYKDTYCTLIRTDVTPEERTDFLLTLRNQIIQYYSDYEFFKELNALIEREIDFLSVGTEAKALTGLRKRIELFYLDLIEKPEYNPKARSYRKARWPKTVDTLYQCLRCNKLLPVCDFPIHTRLLKIVVCTSCEWLQNIGHQRLDMSPYLKLLRQVQKAEMQKCCYTSLCFLLQQIGMYFLTRIIWHGHSAISETMNLAKLCMVRWNNKEEWTPWNTILLTEQEAEFHASIDDVEQFYSPAFISSVHQKHILARIHFFPLLKSENGQRRVGSDTVRTPGSDTVSGEELRGRHASEQSNADAQTRLFVTDTMSLKPASAMSIQSGR